MAEINVKINVNSDNAEDDIKRLKKAFDLLGKTATTSGNTIRSSFNKAWDGAKKFINGFRRGVTVIRNVFKSLISTIGNFIGIASFEELIRSTQKTVSSFISVNNALKTVTRSSFRAKRSMDFLKGTSQKLGTDLNVLAQSYLKFTAAGTKSKLTSDALHDVFSAMAETSIVLQFSTQQMEGAFRALTQMMSKGKVQAEELRGQLGEHLPGAFEIAADSMGLTTKELDEMLKQGLITADMLLNKFAKGLRKEYGTALPGAIRTSTAEFGKLKNEILIFFEENSKTFDDAFGDIARSLRRAFQQVQKAGVLNWLTSSSFGLKEVTNYLENLPKNLMLVYTTAKFGLKTYMLEAKLLYTTISGHIQVFYLKAKELYLNLKSLMSMTNRAEEAELRGTVPNTGVIDRSGATPKTEDFKSLGQKAFELNIKLHIDEKTMKQEITKLEEDLEAETKRINDMFSKGSSKSYIGTTAPLIKLLDETETSRAEKRLKIFQAELEKINKEFEAGETSVHEYNVAISRISLEFDSTTEAADSMFAGMKAGMQDFAGQAGGAMTEFADLTKSALTGVTDAFVQGLAEGKTSFSDFANSILKDLLRILIRLQIVLPIAQQLSYAMGGNPVATMFSPQSSITPGGTFSLGSSDTMNISGSNFQSPMPGTTITGGSPIGFATGGIVTKPTNAIIGEGGVPEAIIPLDKLHRFTGGGGGTTVNIINNSNANVSQETMTGPGGEEMIQVMVEDSVNKMVQNGKFDKVMSPYNVNRTGYR